MIIAVFANDEQWVEVKGLSAKVNFTRLASINEVLPAPAAYFILHRINEFDSDAVITPVFINAVSNTLLSLNAPVNVFRINAWKGFLQSSVWEIAGEITPGAIEVLSELNKKHITVPDEPGFISARIIAMIINEAYFALGEEVSTKQEIDIAMKLGTNYPYGPFEWAEIIGIKNIFLLLQTLSFTDKRCTPAPLLKKEAAAWD